MATRKLTQTGQSTDRVDLEPARDRLPPLTIDPEKVVDAFEAELKSLSSESEPPKSPAVHETAQRLVAKIQAMIPTPPAQLNSGYPLTGLASLFITIAADIPSRHIGHDLLVDTVREIGASPEPAWSEGFFKSLRMMMRDRWNGKLINASSLRLEFGIDESFANDSSQGSPLTTVKTRRMFILPNSGST